jgi:hypothetical protein
MDIELPNKLHFCQFERIARNSSPLDTLFGVKDAVYTLFVTPEHATLHADVAKASEGYLQPLHPSIEQTLFDLSTVTQKMSDPSQKRLLQWQELASIGAILIQFSDYIPSLQAVVQTPFEDTNNLYLAIVEHAGSEGFPLTMPQQLEIALSQTLGNIPDALWRLFITSRLHSRWLDSAIVENMPQMDRSEVVERMYTWQKSLAGFKNTEPQDAAGDTY